MSGSTSSRLATDDDLPCSKLLPHAPVGHSTHTQIPNQVRTVTKSCQSENGASAGDSPPSSALTTNQWRNSPYNTTGMERCFHA